MIDFRSIDADVITKIVHDVCDIALAVFLGFFGHRIAEGMFAHFESPLAAT